MWLQISFLFLLNVLGMIVCKHRSMRVRGLVESPLEDSLHFLSESQSQMMKHMNDWMPFISFSITMVFCRKDILNLIRNGLVFGNRYNLCAYVEKNHVNAKFTFKKCGSLNYPIFPFLV